MTTLSDFANFPRELKALVNNAVPAMAYVRRISDADTISIYLDRRFYDGSVKRIRLRGINAPELSTPEGKIAREALVVLLPLDSPVVVTTFKQTYDRYAADVWFLNDGAVTNLADEIVRLGHAQYV